MFRHLLLLLGFSFVLSFSFTVKPNRLFIGSRVSSLKASTREEEIAKLQEQLRKLEETPEPEPEPEPVLKLKEETPGPEPATYSLAKLKKIADEKALKNVKGKDMLLTERELINARLIGGGGEAGVGLGTLPTILAVLGAAVLLFLFAQVPVGQEDLTRYSATGSSISKTIDLGDLNPDRQAYRQ
jgi:hypothetical protein